MNTQFISINSVKGSKTRGLLRGLLNRGETRSHVKTLNNLRASTSPEDAERVAELLVKSPLFSHLSLSLDFPTRPITTRDVIFEHCWRLVEKDLLVIRLFIDSQRLTWAKMGRFELQKLASDDLQTQASEFCRELNTLTDEKFRALSRWFTRPANLAPSATVQLLLDATLDEVKGHFPDYEPQIERSGLADLELIGMYYHHVYDFMYVVIYNAAKHGKRDGRLIEEIAVPPAVAPGTLEIGIASEICEQDTIELVKASIDSAMSGDIEDAMVVEGRSGLKKLLRMSTDIKEIKSIDVSYVGRFVRFKCVLALDYLR